MYVFNVFHLIVYLTGWIFECFVSFTVYLTHLDYTDTENIMTEKLHNQVNGTEWSWKNLNTVRNFIPSICFLCLCDYWVIQNERKCMNYITAEIQQFFFNVESKSLTWDKSFDNSRMPLQVMIICASYFITDLLGYWINQWSNAWRWWKEVPSHSN